MYNLISYILIERECQVQDSEMTSFIDGLQYMWLGVCVVCAVYDTDEFYTSRQRARTVNIGSVYRFSDTYNIKFIASWICTFVYVWLRFERIFSRHLET